jgi:uncharacterized protein HemX
MPHYDSDDSTIIDSERHSRRSKRPRYRSSSLGNRSRSSEQTWRTSDTTKGRRNSHSGFETAGKVALVVGVLKVAAEVWKHYQKEKEAKQEKEDRRRRRRDFEQAKAARRRDEERREREEEYEYSDDEYSTVTEAKRIGYAPAYARSRSTSRAPRRIEPPRSGRSSRRTSRAPSPDEAAYESDGRGISRHR